MECKTNILQTMRSLLNGQVLWSFDFELQNVGQEQEFRGMFSFMPPIHHHSGNIFLTPRQLIIEGDESVTVNLYDLEQLYLGYDVIYKRSYVKNGGIFWQPLRVSFSASNKSDTIYLVINYNFLGTQNHIWFQTLKQFFRE